MQCISAEMDRGHMVETVQLCAIAFQGLPQNTSYYIVVVLTSQKGEGLPTLKEIMVATGIRDLN